jgi:hypothetical protein
MQLYGLTFSVRHLNAVVPATQNAVCRSGLRSTAFCVAGPTAFKCRTLKVNWYDECVTLMM